MTMWHDREIYTDPWRYTLPEANVTESKPPTKSGCQPAVKLLRWEETGFSLNWCMENYLQNRPQIFTEKSTVQFRVSKVFIWCKWRSVVVGDVKCFQIRRNQWHVVVIDRIPWKKVWFWATFRTIWRKISWAMIKICVLVELFIGGHKNTTFTGSVFLGHSKRIPINQPGFYAMSQGLWIFALSDENRDFPCKPLPYHTCCVGELTRAPQYNFEQWRWLRCGAILVGRLNIPILTSYCSSFVLAKAAQKSKHISSHPQWEILVEHCFFLIELEPAT